MKTVFVTNHALDGNGGGSFASRAYANAFAEISETCVIVLPEPGVDLTGVLNPKLIQIGISNKRSNLHKLFNFYLGRIHRYYNSLPKLIEQSRPDTVVFDNSRCSYRLIDFCKSRNIKVVTIHHNCEVEYYRDELKTHTSLSSKTWKVVLQEYIRRAEKESLIKSDLNLTLTNQDVSLLKDAHGITKDITCERIGCFEFLADNASPNQALPFPSISTRLRIAITGNLSTKQTVSSILNFLTTDFPKISKTIPCSIVIAGRNPDPKISALCSNTPDVQLIPNPPDMLPIIHNADIYLCQANTGGGMKLRVMDGLKAGKPVIAHQVSCRGYEPFLERGVLFPYSDTDTLIEALRHAQELIEKHGNSVSESIKSHYQENFSFSSGVSRLEAILAKQKILNSKTDHHSSV